VGNYMPMTYTTLITKRHDKGGFTVQQNQVSLADDILHYFP